MKLFAGGLLPTLMISSTGDPQVLHLSLIIMVVLNRI
jgi:hypothetical protein